MAGLIIASGAAIVSNPTNRATLTLDTRGATVIYIFAYSVFQPGVPFDGLDSKGNTWLGLGNPFATCNGSTGAWRVFNPITSATHNFRVNGNPSWTTQLIVVAMAPTFTGNSYVLRRADSDQPAPAHPGAINPLVNNYAMITSCVAGCGFDVPLVDSGFSIVEALPEIAVATSVQTAGLIDVSWSGFTPNPGAPGGIVTAGVIIEGFGIYNGQPPPGGSNTRIYEA